MSQKMPRLYNRVTKKDHSLKQKKAYSLINSIKVGVNAKLVLDETNGKNIYTGIIKEHNGYVYLDSKPFPINIVDTNRHQGNPYILKIEKYL